MSEQPRDRIGQYAATLHGEPAVALAAAAAPAGDFGLTTDQLNAMPGELMGPGQVRQWADAELSHCVAPAIGMHRSFAHKGNESELRSGRLDDAYGQFAASVVGKLARDAAAGPMVAPDADDRLERLQLKPGADMDADEITGWVVLELQDRLTPLRNRITEDAAAGKDTAGLAREFMATAQGFSSDVAAKFRPGPTAEDLS